MSLITPDNAASRLITGDNGDNAVSAVTNASHRLWGFSPLINGDNAVSAVISAYHAFSPLTTLINGDKS